MCDSSCVDASPLRQCKWAGRAIPAAAPSAYPVEPQISTSKTLDFQNSSFAQHTQLVLPLKTYIQSYIPLISNSPNSCCSSWPGQANEMSTANVTGKQRGAHLNIDESVRIRISLWAAQHVAPIWLFKCELIISRGLRLVIQFIYICKYPRL